MKKIIYLFIIVILSIFIVGCNKKSNEENNNTEKTITDLTIDTTNVNEDVTKFKVSDIKINIIYSDNTEETIDATKDMFSEADLESIKKKGIYTLTLEYAGMFKDVELVFSKASENVTVTFYVEGNVYETITVKAGSSIADIPECPRKEGYKNSWDVESLSKLYQDVDVHAVYTYIEPFTETEEADFFNEVGELLDSKYEGIKIDSDIELIDEYEYHTISWTSTNQDVIDNSGKYTKTYTKQVVTLTASIKGLYSTLTKEYTYTFNGYKSLENGINAGYIYRSYSKVTDEFFDTLDIVYASFILVDTDGGFTGTNATGGDLQSEFTRMTTNISTYIMPKAREKGVYVVPSLGGGGSSPAQTFAIIASSEETRKAFAKNIVDLINKYDYDGIDIDWETPASSNSSNFTLLMKEIYTAVKANNPNHIVTAAIGGGAWQPPCYDLTNSIQYLDYVNMMTYGMDNGLGRYQNALYANSTYFDKTNKVGATLYSCSIDESLKIYQSYKVPNNKIIIGLAFYGMVQSKETGTWTASGSSITYDAVKERIASGEYTRYYDTRCKVPYLLSNDGLTFITYDDPESIKDKIEYCKTNNLAGVMYWENGCDLTGDLLQAMKEGYNK